MKGIFLLMLTLLLCNIVSAQFVEINAGIPGLASRSTAWGDFDNDGDLDILTTGELASWDRVATVYHNNGNGTFTDIGAGLTGVMFDSGAWGDYDNDGYLDILLTGWTDAQTSITKVYHNNGNSTFSEINTGLVSLSHGAAAWGDFDNDGDLDIILTGSNSNSGWEIASKIYRNNGDGTFTDTNTVLAPVMDSSVTWGDYDNDSDLDLLLTGYNGNNEDICKLYRNDGDDAYTDTLVDLPGADSASVAWGDYDSDGVLDLLFTGNDFENTEYFTGIYHNNGDDTFTDIANMFDIAYGSTAWGDYDNDGDLDILISGNTYSSNYTSIYRNDGNNEFTNININLPGVNGSSARWGDYDNDGDLDILINGYNGNYIFRIYRNDTDVVNAPPEAPTNLTQTREGDYTIFRWNAALDDHTPSSGMTYMLRIGTTSGGCEITGSMAGTDGQRRTAEMGYANSICRWKIKTDALPADDHYFWTVQVIDTAFKGSAFATEIEVNPAGNEENIISTGMAVLGNACPNPFRNETTIKYSLNEGSPVRIDVFNVKGQRVSTLLSEVNAAGDYQILWNGKDQQGSKLTSGIYLYTMKAGSYLSTKKVLLLQ